eukprot:g8055.t1
MMLYYTYAEKSELFCWVKNFRGLSRHDGAVSAMIRLLLSPTSYFKGSCFSLPGCLRDFYYETPLIQYFLAPLLALSLYFVAGIALSTYNKWLFDPRLEGLSFPLSIIALQMFFNFVCASLLVLLMWGSNTIRRMPMWITNLG